MTRGLAHNYQLRLSGGERQTLQNESFKAHQTQGGPAPIHAIDVNDLY